MMKSLWCKRQRSNHNKPVCIFPASGRKNGSVRGFTLIELLVVISIIAILASILFPAFSRARENSRKANCQSNLKQIMVGFSLYTTDNNGTFPPLPPLTNPDDANSGDGSAGWALSIAEMIKNDQILQCPSESKSADDGFTDYWMNADMIGVSDAKVQSPANVILTGDGHKEDTATSADYYMHRDYATGPFKDDLFNWSRTELFTTRHLEGANYLFADGHVKWLKPNQISTTVPPNGSNFTFLIE